MLSIILPTYNSQNTVIRAISSCLDSINDIEIIVVDDGSTDQTVSVVKQKYSALIKKNKIKLISANHGGAGNARNIGMDNAFGEWIMFLDSDDEFLDLSTVVADLKKTKNDSFDIINYSTNKEKLSSEHSNYIVNGKNLTADNLGLSRKNLRVWNSRPSYKTFRKNFLIKNSIKFPLDIKIGEDLIFNQLCLKTNTNVLVRYSNIYKVIENDNSITHTIVNQDILDDGIKLVNATQRLDIPDKLELEFVAKNFVSLLVRYLKSNYSIEIIIKSLEHYKLIFEFRKSYNTFFDLRYSLGLPISVVSWLIWQKPSILKVLFPLMKKIKY